MEQIKSEDLRNAVLTWTGRKTTPSPLRDDGLVLKSFGKKGKMLLDQIKALEDDFYKSDAHLRAASLVEMEQMAIQHFTALHPDLDKEIAQAFAWCYSFDYK